MILTFHLMTFVKQQRMLSSQTQHFGFDGFSRFWTNDEEACAWHNAY